jgi:hypothetical protein
VNKIFNSSKFYVIFVILFSSIVLAIPNSIDTELALAKNNLVRIYKISKLVKPLKLGSEFPELKLDVIKGKNPDWNKYSLVTVGTLSSTSAQSAHQSLKDKNIQRIHIVSGGEVNDSMISRFPDKTIFLDGIDYSAPLGVEYVKLSIAKSLGIYRDISAFLISQKKVIWRKVNAGGFDDLVKYVGNKNDNSLKDQFTFEIGKQVNFLEFNKIDSKAISKGITVVLFSDVETCGLCSNWLQETKSYFSKWERSGIKFILLTKSEIIYPFSQERKIYTSMNAEIFKKYGIVTYPGAIILRDGNFDGFLNYVELTIEGKKYNQAFFNALNEVIYSKIK